ncbi:aminoacyl-tRNA hydrolase [soil metagenome]
MIDLLRRLIGGLNAEPEPGTKFIFFLGNPGPQYSTTRHNVAWWLADRVATEWFAGRFRKEGSMSVARAVVNERPVELIKPLTYMNRSGQLVRPLPGYEWFDAARDLLVVVDDVALDPGRARLRPTGSSGGHNGLRSIEAALETTEYPRLRIGVGSAPAGADLAEWVLSSPPPEERRRILDLYPELQEALDLWVKGDVEMAMNRANSAGRREGGS